MSDTILVSTRKGLFTISRGPQKSWSITSVSFLGDNCTIAIADGRTVANGRWTCYAALDHGHFGCKMQRSRDGGRSWQEIAAPKYPEKPAGYKPTMKPAEGREYDWALKLIWSIAPGGGDQNGRVWCGTLPGGLFVSNDEGDSWRLVESLWLNPLREEWFGGGAEQPGIHSIIIDPRNSDHVTIGVSCGGAWTTHDDGSSWSLIGKGMRAEFMPPERMWDQNIQDPHLLVQCPASPDVMWVQHHNGIFRSIDGAQTFTEITDVQPSVFGFAVTAHPHDEKAAWFVPAIKDEKRIPAGGRVIVTRTRDGGRSFQQLTKGLPQEHAYDLVFRHAMDVDESGEVLAFGSTTGSLWVSENAGDSWTNISTHLPPIYAVRFVKQS